MGTFTIAGREFRSRLIVGTGKYRSFQEMQRCHAASGAEMVTVAVRRVNLRFRCKKCSYTVQPASWRASSLELVEKH